MKIISGRGKNRKVVIELPCAAIVKASPDKEQIMTRDLVCDIIGIRR